MSLDDRIRSNVHSNWELLPFLGPFVTLTRIIDGKKCFADSYLHSSRVNRAYNLYIASQAVTAIATAAYFLTDGFTDNTPFH